MNSECFDPCTGTRERTIGAGMSFDEFAGELISIAAHQRQTPVLVADRSLRFGHLFFVELARHLACHGREPMSCPLSMLRIEWCRTISGPMGALSTRWAYRRASAVTRALSTLSSAGPGGQIDASMEVTSSVSRPSRDPSRLVIGWCAVGADLPSWTVPVQLSA